MDRVDPLTKQYPELTPYQFASNSPIANIDLDGLEKYYAPDGKYIGKYGDNAEIKIVNKDHIAAATYLVGNQNNPSSDAMNTK